MPDPPAAEPQVRLTFRQLGGGPAWPLSARLRLLLKYALRTLRLKCVSVEWLPPAPAPDLGAENARLRRMIEGLAERVARQAELLSARAEKGGGRGG